MAVKQRLLWLLRRAQLMRRVPQFHAPVSAFADAFTRFEGHNRLYRHSHVFNSTFGRFTYVADFAHVGAADVGPFVSIGPDSRVGGLGSHPVDRLSTSPAFYSVRRQTMEAICTDPDFVEFKRTRIGPDVWIGARAIIMDGVTLAPGTIVAAGAIVSKDTEPFSIVAGVPAKLLRYRYPPDKIARILADPWWAWEIDKLHSRSALFGAEGHRHYD
jgi:chloramphenicol O-acetyltransferase type B